MGINIHIADNHPVYIQRAFKKIPIPKYITEKFIIKYYRIEFINQTN